MPGICFFQEYVFGFSEITMSTTTADNLNTSGKRTSEKDTPGKTNIAIPTPNPWDWYIYLHMITINRMANAGKNIPYKNTRYGNGKSTNL